MPYLWTFCPACKVIFTSAELASSSCTACGRATTGLAEATGEDCWFLAHGRKKVGPVSRKHLQLLVAAGVLRPADMVLRVGETKWVNVSAALGLVSDIPIAQPVHGATISAYPSTGQPPQLEQNTESNQVDHQATDVPRQEAVSSVPQAGSGTRSEAPVPIIAGYEIQGVLGRGGMGVVYKARQLSLKRDVALKMILAGSHAGDEMLTRFRAEAETIAHLQHPHIVQIYDVGEQNGCPYFALELVEGSTLAQRVAKGPVSAAEAATLVETLGRAIHHAHQRGIIHRDLKPSNVLLTADGTPKITDFGLAKQLEGDMGQTRSGAVLGTPSYMAPEQAAGKVREIGPHTDVYALGAVLYELLAGRPPFRGRTLMDTLEQVRLRDPVAPSRLRPKVPRDLETICLKALAKEPALRYPTALALAHDLARFQAGEPILGRRQGLVRKAWRKLRRSPALVASLLVALLIGAGGFGYFTVQEKSRARQVGDAVRAIDTGLQTLECSEEQLVGMEGQIDELSRLSPEQAAAARDRLVRRFGETIRSTIHGPRLEPEAIDRVEHALNLLAVRAPDLAQPLREELAHRRGNLETVIDLRVGERATAPFQPAADSRNPFLVRTHERCLGNVEMTAVFSAWENATQIGVVLHSGELTGYTFLLKVAPPSPTTPEPLGAETNAGDKGQPPATASFAQARRSGRRFAMQILQNGVVLRQRLLWPSELSTSTVVMSARHTGVRLVFQLNADRTMEFQDVFPLAGGEQGVFALEWPAGVRLESLTAARQSIPATPSPLERGDDYFSRGRLSDAVKEYKVQGNLARQDLVRQEARFKQALCLTRLGEDAEAEIILGALAEETGPDEKDRRWAVLAECQLWLLYLRQQQFQKADAIIEKLSVRDDLTFERLAVHVPWDVIQSISSNYYTAGINLVTRNPRELLRNAERLVRVQNLLDPSTGARRVGDEKYWSRLGLLKASQLAGAGERALVVAQELIKDYGPEVRACELLCWLLRSRGDHRRALTLVDQWLKPTPDGLYLLYVERARINIALEKWEDARKDLDEYFRLRREKKDDDYNWFSNACIVQGYVYLHLKQDEAAQAYWRKGLYKNAGTGPGDRQVKSLDVDPSAAVNSMILSALTGESSDEDDKRNAAWLVALTARDPSVAKYVELARLAPKSFVEMWRTPRGQDWARRYALRDLTYAEAVRVPALLLVFALLRPDITADPLTREQDDMVWKLVEEMYFAYVNGKLRKEDLFAVYSTWTGLPGFGEGSWKALVKKLQPTVRGPLAYVMGLRYRTMLKRPTKDTIEFFRTAVADAPPDSPLRRLAQEELDRTAPK